MSAIRSCDLLKMDQGWRRLRESNAPLFLSSWRERPD